MKKYLMQIVDSQTGERSSVFTCTTAEMAEMIESGGFGQKPDDNGQSVPMVLIIGEVENDGQMKMAYDPLVYAHHFGVVYAERQPFIGVPEHG